MNYWKTQPIHSRIIDTLMQLLHECGSSQGNTFIHSCHLLENHEYTLDTFSRHEIPQSPQTLCIHTLATFIYTTTRHAIYFINFSLDV